MLFFLLIIVRLAILQIVEHAAYTLRASSAHEQYKKIHPERGKIFFQDSRTGEIFPAAVNREYYKILAAPARIPPRELASTTESIITLLGVTDDAEKQTIRMRMAKINSYHQVLANKVDEKVARTISDQKIIGIEVVPEEFRFYPEGRLAATVIGFSSQNDKGVNTGKYGIEGFWDRELSGKLGLISGEKSAGGNWITLAGRTVIPAEEGVDVVLTIDRTLQFEICQKLEEKMQEYRAENASLVVLNPKNGAILAMCSYPDFNPNEFNKVSSTAQFNNTAIFTPYEPGSVFKAITMATALDLNLVTPLPSIPAPPAGHRCVRALLPPGCASPVPASP
jgi:cell division protein FtsI/penicillin-binding protein 2